MSACDDPCAANHEAEGSVGSGQTISLPTTEQFEPLIVAKIAAPSDAELNPNCVRSRKLPNFSTTGLRYKTSPGCWWDGYSERCFNSTIGATPPRALYTRDKSPTQGQIWT